MNFKKFNNLLEVFNYQYKIQKHDEIFLQSLKNQNSKFTWSQVHELVQRLSNKLSSVISEGDRCLLISENRPEWLISDLAIMLSNGVTVPAYTTYTERDYDYLINDCKPTVIIISDSFQFKKIKNLIHKYSFIKLVISFDQINDEKIDVYYFKNILDKKKIENKNLDKLNLQRNDVACIIYTSGTQGSPKGVMLSHGGILSNCEGSV